MGEREWKVSLKHQEATIKAEAAFVYILLRYLIHVTFHSFPNQLPLCFESFSSNAHKVHINVNIVSTVLSWSLDLGIADCRQLIATNIEMHFNCSAHSSPNTLRKVDEKER